MYRTATNESITFINKRAKDKNIDISKIHEHLVSNLVSDVYFSGAEIQQILQKTIATLPQKQKLVFNIKSVTNENAGFSVPKNYFSAIEERFSSFLLEDKLSKEIGFTIPKNYFYKLENSIKAKIIPKKEIKPLSLKSNILKYIPIATAASIALFLNINYLNPKCCNG